MNEELVTQESLPATMQEAYNSLMENLSENTIPESDNSVENNGDSVSFELSEE